MNKSVFTALSMAILCCVFAGCSTAPPTDEKREALDDSVQRAVDAMRADSSMFADFLDKSYAYAVFPSVGEGALGVGAAAGRGEVFSKGRMIGYSNLIKATVGLQAGGQEFSEVICFEDDAALRKFMDHEFSFSAGANAVALKSGVAANARFQDGVAVFQHTKGGLMAAAAIGGQKFHYVPKGMAQ
jgi:lipid-binding SYLF domain-containing protein